MTKQLHQRKPRQDSHTFHAHTIPAPGAWLNVRLEETHMRMLLMMGCLMALSGCHAIAKEPWFDVGDSVSPVAAVGNWNESGKSRPATLQFIRAQGNTLRFTWHKEESDEEVRPMTLMAARIGKSTFIDATLAPDAPPFTDDGVDSHAHFLYRVVLDGDTLTIHMLKKGWLEELLKEDAAKVPMLESRKKDGDRTILLPTKDLKELLRKLDRSTSQNLWDEPAVFTRVRR